MSFSDPCQLTLPACQCKGKAWKDGEWHRLCLCNEEPKPLPSCKRCEGKGYYRSESDTYWRGCEDCKPKCRTCNDWLYVYPLQDLGNPIPCYTCCKTGGIPGGIPHKQSPPGESQLPSTEPMPSAREFITGAKRDSAEGKPSFHRIPVSALRRVAMRYTEGDKHYGEENWQKGIPLKELYASLLRHVYAWRLGDTTEDHLAAVIWNALTLIYTEEKIQSGELPQELAK